MAMSADSPVNSHPSLVSPASSPAGDGVSGVTSPQSRRRSLQSPWSQVVRGGEPESSSVPAVAPLSPLSSPPIAAAAGVPPEPTHFSDCSGRKPSPESFGSETQPENSDSSSGNAALSKKPAWNKPLNGVVEGSSIMGGSVTWPALSESTRSTTKSSSDSPKPLTDGSTSSSQVPIISQSPQKQANNNTNTNSVANHGVTRQKSMKHRGTGSAQGGFRPPPPSPPPMPPPFPTVIEITPYGNFGNFVPPVLDSSVRGARPLGGAGSQSENDQSSHSQRNSSRRNNFGGRPRGDGQYHNNRGARRDHDRRDVHLPHQFVPPPGGYMPPPPPPPPGSASFIAPPPMRPFVGPMGFDMASPFMYVPTLPPESFRGMPFIAQAPPTPMFFPVMDPLPALIIKQIEYYFSDANLVKDDYLRSNMDDEGWVPINLIASFPRVQQLTADIPLILDSLRASAVVEVKEQGDKIRRRNEWKKWTHSGSRIAPDSGSQTPSTSLDDTLMASIEKISLNEVTSSNRGGLDLIDTETERAPDRSLPDESTGSLKMANGEVTAEEFDSS